MHKHTHPTSTTWSMQKSICTEGSFKSWKHSNDVLMVLFDHPRNMSLLFGLGVPCGLLSMRREGDLVSLDITQLTYSRWLTLWQDERIGRLTSLSKLISQYGNWPSSSGSHAFPGGSETSASVAASPLAPPTSSQQGNPISQQQAGPGPSVSEGINSFSLQDGGLRKLHITVLIGNKGGEGLDGYSPLMLARNINHCCELWGKLDFYFSETPQPPTQPRRRLLELAIEACYHLKGECRVEPVPPLETVLQPHTSGLAPPIVSPSTATGGAAAVQLRVGIIHDHLYVNFGCEEQAAGSVLLEHEATNVSTIDMSKKEATARQTGWEGGISLSAHGIGSASAKHTRGSSSSKEATMVSKLNVAQETAFRLFDMSRGAALVHVLAFRATHTPPMEHLTSLHQAGLEMVPRKFLTSGVALPSNLKCRGIFMLRGSGLKNHNFEMGRTLGEFNIKQPPLKILRILRSSQPLLLQGDQKLALQFVVNHDFDLNLYNGSHLYWLLGGAEPTPAPDVLNVVNG